MPDHDAQTVILSRPTILLVTGVGVGLLTLTYVLGVQVGKQSAALRQPRGRAAGEELTELPASLDEQLKLLDNREFEKVQKTGRPGEAPRAEAPAAEAPGAEAGKGAEAKADAKPAEGPKPEAPKVEAKKPEAKGDRWTLQLVATPNEAEAKRVAEKAKTAGFSPTLVKEKGHFKVRLAKSGTRAEMDAAAARLKAKGQPSFPVKAE